MSSTSRVLNRGLLLLCGLLLGAAGAAAILAGAPPGSTSGWLSMEPVGAALSQAASTAAGLPAVGGAPGALIAALTVAVLLTALLVVFVCTRRGRRTATVLDLRSDDGHVRVDPNVADALLAGTLGERPDVLSAGCCPRPRKHSTSGTHWRVSACRSWSICPTGAGWTDSARPPGCADPARRKNIRTGEKAAQAPR
jgi:hypothetical protein